MTTSCSRDCQRELHDSGSLRIEKETFAFVARTKGSFQRKTCGYPVLRKGDDMERDPQEDVLRQLHGRAVVQLGSRKVTVEEIHSIFLPL